MKVTVRTNCLSRNLNQMIEIVFSYKPDSDVLNELKKNGWWWINNKGCWSHYYSDKNLQYAMSLKNRFNNQYTYTSKPRSRSRSIKFYNDDDPFAYLRKKTPMRKKFDYGVYKTGANMTSVYDSKFFHFLFSFIILFSYTSW